MSVLASKHSRRQVLAEIETCELVCANCHALRTAQRRTAAAQGPVTIGVTGIEPVTSASQRRRATRLRHTP